MNAEQIAAGQDSCFRSGFVALLGKPNVGKSTLLNAFLGRKLSIVTRKAQTTRNRILGILTGASSQIVFVDTPGLLKPRYKLHESMLREVTRAAADADVVVLVTTATSQEPDTASLKLTRGRCAILAVNKIDLVDQRKVLPLVARYMELQAFEAVVPLSAKSGQNVEVLKQEIEARLPQGPRYFDEDVVSDHPDRFFVAEIIREKLFERLRDEVPYSTTVQVCRYEERDGSKDLIEAEIVVERPTQKGILIGAGGQALKAVAIAARQDVETFLGRPVFLKLFVKVRSDWRNREGLLRSYGH